MLCLLAKESTHFKANVLLCLLFSFVRALLY